MEGILPQLLVLSHFFGGGAKKSFLSNGPPVIVFQCLPSKTAKLLDISSLYSQCLSKHSLKSPPQRLRLIGRPLIYTPKKNAWGSFGLFVGFLVGGGGDCLFVEVKIFLGRSFFCV